MHLPVLSPAQSAAWDARAQQAGISLATLMDAAGRAAAQVIVRRHGARLRNGVLIVAGPGNNGGDGWVIAQVLHRMDYPVFVAPLGARRSELNQKAAARSLADGVRQVDVDGPWPGVGLVVDALLGTGASGPPRAELALLLERIRDLALPVVAIDGPTGVDLASGTTHEPSLHAECSITFGGPRRGHLLARDECGDIITVDIGLGAPDPAWPRLMTDQLAAQAVRPFAAGSHKGTRGRVVVVGGDSGMSGALRLAGRASFAAGAGLVHAVAPVETIAALTAAEPDLQTLAHSFDRPPVASLVDLIANSDALVIGPGLGREAGRREFIAALMAPAGRVVLDADALNAFQGASKALAQAARGRQVVLTPHPGEFRRLFPEFADGMEVDPWRSAEAAAEAMGAVVLLKGVPTVVSSKRESITVAAGNPGLATGGSGDTLSGLIGTLLAQEMEPLQAAAVSAQALGRAGDLAARRYTARAMRPMDVIAALPDLWRSWTTLREVGRVADPPVLHYLERPITT
ncbi:MAG TPA: NAD(P)H-hydrate dehydratase [Gemmatimonadales bacterium]|nr:NAD(P)H-hydrate dehydratase [Gemmatimonadales bacterium]